MESLNNIELDENTGTGKSEPEERIDIVIPFYVWFVLGFGIISVLIGIINFSVNLVTMLTVKGIFIPVWAIIILAVIMVGFCVLVGYIFEKYKLWDKINSHQNQNMNPEIRAAAKYGKKVDKEMQIMKSDIQKIMADNQKIKKALGITDNIENEEAP
jgi:uncharacterized membrane protein (DUF106 family)